MKRAIILGLGAFGVAAAAIPTLAIAADFPPPPPTTYYGTVPAGISAGQAVVAIVTEGQNAAACGGGTTVQDGSNVVYVIDVVADAQRTGCGKAGRTVQFYFPPTASTGGRMATDTATYPSQAGPVNKNITGVGAPLNRRGVLPQIASDKPAF